MNGFYDELKAKFKQCLEENGLLQESILITTRALTAEEAIGVTRRQDFPIITGKDVMIQAECRGAVGQAFTDAPAAFCGTLAQICEVDLEEDAHGRGLFIASLNAVMRYLGKTDCTVHCRGEGPERCAPELADYVAEQYGNPRIALFGYQPAMLECLSRRFAVRVVDLSPQNIGQERYGVMVEDGAQDQSGIWAWADLVLCTGSTVCNGTIVNFLDREKPVLFYGTSLAGAAVLMDLPAVCFADRYQ